MGAGSGFRDGRERAGGVATGGGRKRRALTREFHNKFRVNGSPLLAAPAPRPGNAKEIPNQRPIVAANPQGTNPTTIPGDAPHLYKIPTKNADHLTNTNSPTPSSASLPTLPPFSLTMSAPHSTCVLHGPQDLRYESRPTTPPKPGQAQVQVVSTGICGSDRTYYSPTNAPSLLLQL